MSNVVIATKDELCQAAKGWFMRNEGCLEGPSNFDELKDGERLYIIAHDTELGNGDELIRYMSGNDIPMTKFHVVLIVCSAAKNYFGKSLATPAENLANFFKRDVWASKTLVYVEWRDNDGAIFTGDFIVVKPGDDLESLMAKLKI